MAGRIHRYPATIVWTGNTGSGTRGPGSYQRAHTISIAGKPDLLGSSDPGFRGDAKRHNPEDLLVASLSSCHMLWYLALCAAAGIVVTAYQDHAEGTMLEDADGGGRFTSVVLRPEVVLAPGADQDRAIALHHAAHAKCFVANSVNFPVTHEPRVSVEEGCRTGPDASAKLC
jgi:organic hydroperoxide reductase OsmC/OhrA